MDLIQAANEAETLDTSLPETATESGAEILSVAEPETVEAVSAENVEDAPQATTEPPEIDEDTGEVAEDVEDGEEPEEVHLEGVEGGEESVTAEAAAVEGPEAGTEEDEIAADGAREAAKAADQHREGQVDVEQAAEGLAEDAEAEEDGDEGSSDEMAGMAVEDWDYQRPKRGQIRTGVILSIGEQEIVVDVDAKRDGIVPYADMQRMGDEALAKLSAGDEVLVYILRPEDQDGNLLVSLYQARQAQSWQRAAELAEKGESWEGEVTGYNKGGLVVPVDDVRGFIPASQLSGFPQGLSQDERLRRLSEMVGQRLRVKVIEINRRNRRLILSATAAEREWRQERREELLEELREGEVRTGTVSSLCSFGAFVDLGGADGLVHLSELSWRRVRHPREAVRVGQKVDVYVMRLDHERKRIGLSLKRLQPEPWALVEDKYELGQLVEGLVTNVVEFGAFAEIEEGVEGLIHVSELTEQSISHPRDVVKKGDLLLLRIIRIDIRRRRLGLSLKRVLEAEWAEWAARMAVSASAEPGVAEKPAPVVEPEPEPAAAPEAEDKEEPAAAATEPEEPPEERDEELTAAPDLEVEGQAAVPELKVEPEPDVVEPEPEHVIDVEEPEIEPESPPEEGALGDEDSGDKDADEVLEVAATEQIDAGLDAGTSEGDSDVPADQVPEPEGEEAEATQEQDVTEDEETPEPDLPADVEEAEAAASGEADDDPEPVEDDSPDALEDQPGDMGESLSSD